MDQTIRYIAQVTDLPEEFWLAAERESGGPIDLREVGVITDYLPEPPDRDYIVKEMCRRYPRYDMSGVTVLKIYADGSGDGPDRFMLQFTPDDELMEAAKDVGDLPPEEKPAWQTMMEVGIVRTKNGEIDTTYIDPEAEVIDEDGEAQQG